MSKIQASISGDGKVIKYHISIFVVVIELFVRCLKYRLVFLAMGQ